MHAWLSKVALDAYVAKLEARLLYLLSKPRIGAGAFDYDFGAVEGTGNKLTKSYANLGCGSIPS